MADFTPYLSCTRASTGYAQTVAGAWVAFAANELRITDKGLLVEEARTNYLLNSGAPATQTTQSLATGSYCLWVEGTGSALASGGTATITGAASATEGSPNVFTVTVAGTVIVTVTGSLDRFQLEAGAYPTSYIPTTSAAVTRAADDVRMIGAANTIMIAAAHSAVVSMDVIPQTTQAQIVSAFTLGGVPLYKNSSTVVASWNNNVAPTKSGLADATTNAAKYGYAWDAVGISVTGQGLTVATAAGAPGSAIVTPTLGSSGGAVSVNSYIRRLSFWDSRISDSDLQSRTA